jgi:hypothetical protein
MFVDKSLYLYLSFYSLVLAMKADRKRLKAEKLDLLNQLKQLYGTLEEKEAELRDFIRNYEQRMRESDESIKQVQKLRWGIMWRCHTLAGLDIVTDSTL